VPGELILSEPAEVVALSGVGVVRDGSPILRDIDWTIRAGERWVVLGPNGSGKSTLLAVLATYLHPSAGYVAVLGEQLGHTDVRVLRRRIGYASANLNRMLHDRLTALEAVATARAAALDPWWYPPTDDDLARARAVLAAVGCDSLGDRPLGVLSEGERQRVQVARALMSEAELLLLDEPAAGLDLGGRERIVRHLSELAGSQGSASIVFVTHHVEEIPHHFTHVLLLRKGTVHAAGAIEETLTAEALSSCFELPLRLGHHLGRWSAHGIEPGTAEATEDGRAKAYRPLGDASRLVALDAGLRAFSSGEYFEAHELLEPAWMGTHDRRERNLYQGIIKLAAAGVHAARGNAEGVRRNLEGAGLRLGRVFREDGTVQGDARCGAVQGDARCGAVQADEPTALGRALAVVDVPALLAWIDHELAALVGGSAPDADRFALGQATWDRRR
jgi:iron complex transport system ATP-binding protein